MYISNPLLYLLLYFTTTRFPLPASRKLGIPFIANLPFKKVGKET